MIRPMPAALYRISPHHTIIPVSLKPAKTIVLKGLEPLDWDNSADCTDRTTRACKTELYAASLRHTLATYREASTASPPTPPIEQTYRSLPLSSFQWEGGFVQLRGKYVIYIIVHLDMHQDALYLFSAFMIATNS